MKWEYKFLRVWQHDDIDKLGLEGWEAYGVGNDNVYFKRPIKEPEPVTKITWPQNYKWYDMNGKEIHPKEILTSSSS